MTALLGLLGANWKLIAIIAFAAVVIVLAIYFYRSSQRRSEKLGKFKEQAETSGQASKVQQEMADAMAQSHTPEELADKWRKGGSLVILLALLSACDPQTVTYICAPNPHHPQSFWNKAADELDALKATSPNLKMLLDERDAFGEAAKRCAAAMRTGKKG